MLNKGSGGEQTPTVSGASLILEEKRNSNEIRPKQRGQEIEIAVSERIWAYHSFSFFESINSIRENSVYSREFKCIREYAVYSRVSSNQRNTLWNTLSLDS